MLNVQDLVDAKLYDSREAAIEDAVRHLLRSRPDLRIQVAIHRYLNESLSLAVAANIAGVSWLQMKEILIERGIPPRLGPDTIAEAQDEVESLRNFFNNRSTDS
jgi:predicted HTH domain antitoxin